jgi:hypothetical protein
MDRLGPELSKKARWAFLVMFMNRFSINLENCCSSIYRHNLMAVLETAIRASNIQFENPDIIERLDVRMMEASPGDSGWDVFSLDYQVIFCMLEVIQLHNNYEIAYF